MRLVELLQVIGAVIGALAVAFAATERLLVKRFRSQGARSSATAIELTGLKAVTRWQCARLRSAGVIVEDRDARSYLDKTVYRSLRKRRAMLVVPAVALAIALVVFLHRALG